MRGVRVKRDRVGDRAVHRDGLRRTLAELVPWVGRVVFGHQGPVLGFDPAACPPGAAMPACTITRAAVLDRQRAYREEAETVLREFPQVARVDPLDIFCDACVCHVVREGVMMSRDDDHAGVLGAGLIAQAIMAYRLDAQDSHVPTR